MTLRVPHIAEDAIEHDAQGLLAQYAYAKSVEIRAPIPIEDIVEKHLKLRVEFDDLHRLLDIPRHGLGLRPDIFGATLAAWCRQGHCAARPAGPNIGSIRCRGRDLHNYG